MTHPTKEQALAAYQFIEKEIVELIIDASGDEHYGAKQFASEAEMHLKVLRTYIEGEKDSLGADDEPDCMSCSSGFPASHIAHCPQNDGSKKVWPVCDDHANYARIAGWLPVEKIASQIHGNPRDKIDSPSKSDDKAPASAHVPGIEKVREALKNADIVYKAKDYHLPGNDLGNSIVKTNDEARAILDQQGVTDHFRDPTKMVDKQDVQKSVSPDYARGYIEGVKNQKERFDALCEKYGAQSPFADLRAKVIGLTKQEDRITTYPSVAQIHNAALDAVLALIDGKGE